MTPPIIKSGYADPGDRRLRTALYKSAKWKQCRLVVLERDQGLCRICGRPPAPGESLDVAHADRTTDVLRAGEIAFDPDGCISAHRACHSKYASGRADILPIGTRR